VTRSQLYSIAGCVIVMIVDLLILWYSGLITPYRVEYFFAGLFAMALFVFIFLPSHERAEGKEKTRLAYLYERKEVVYENLRDLNFEHKAGKFTESDFEAMRNSMEAEAARILAEIEKFERPVVSS